MFVDVVESVRLVDNDEMQAISRWLALTGHVCNEVLPRFGGRFVKNLGDGMLLAFDEVRAAVATAFAIQAACHRDNRMRPADQQMHLRMGIESSDVIVDHGDVYGRGVNLAERLMQLAGPGELILSANARDELTPSLDADIEDLGDCYLKHFSEPVRAYRVGPPGPRPVVAMPPIDLELAPAIAVVPFAPAESMDSDHRVIGEILAEEVIKGLSRSAELRVISRLSTTPLRGRDLSLDEINDLLDADYVLTGKYRIEGGQIALFSELTESKSGQILWAQRLRDSVSDIVAAEPQLVGRLLAEVAAAVMRSELRRARQVPLPNLRSYTLLVAAIMLMHRLSLRDFEEARHLLQTVIDRGARQAIPQAWLANWHVLRVQQGWSVDQKQDAYHAMEATKRALDADPQCSMALAMDGLVHTHMVKRHDIAMDRYQSAVDANPSDAQAWLLKGTLHAFMGEGESAVADTQRARLLTPLDPHRYYYDSLAATACMAAHQYERALALARQSLRANRTHTSTLRVLAASQWHTGLHDEARETAAELLRLEPNLTVSSWLQRSPAAPYVTGREWSEVLRQVGIPE